MHSPRNTILIKRDSTNLLRQLCSLPYCYHWVTDCNRHIWGELCRTMILRRVTSDARTIASSLLMLCGALTQAKAQVASDQDTRPAPVEATAADTAKRDTGTGDVVVRQRGVASWYGRAW